MLLQVSLILNDPELFADWKRDICTMAHRIIDMRKELYRLLTEEFKTPGNWDHILNQIGMFRCVNRFQPCSCIRSFCSGISVSAVFRWNTPRSSTLLHSLPITAPACMLCAFAGAEVATVHIRSCLPPKGRLPVRGLWLWFLRHSNVRQCYHDKPAWRLNVPASLSGHSAMCVALLVPPCVAREGATDAESRILNQVERRSDFEDLGCAGGGVTCPWLRYGLGSRLVWGCFVWKPLAPLWACLDFCLRKACSDWLPRRL